MNKHYTIMVIPDEKGNIKKLKIPAVVIHSAAMLIAMISIIVAIMVFDYWKIFDLLFSKINPPSTSFISTVGLINDLW